MQAILGWLIGVLLEFLKNWAIQEAVAKAGQVEKEKQQGITNEANVIAYNAAADRADRVIAATDLLNRNRK